MEKNHKQRSLPKIVPNVSVHQNQSVSIDPKTVIIHLSCARYLEVGLCNVEKHSESLVSKIYQDEECNEAVHEPYGMPTPAYCPVQEIFTPKVTIIKDNPRHNNCRDLEASEEQNLVQTMYEHKVSTNLTQSDFQPLKYVIMHLFCPKEVLKGICNEKKHSEALSPQSC